MRIVMDTDVVVAAMRSPTGASAALVRAAREDRLTMVATVPLCLEYESVCSRPEHQTSAGLSAADVQVFIDAIVELVVPIPLWFLWRPQLNDIGDELVLEAAVNGGAGAIVTFNRRDFRSGAARFGVDVLLPSEALRRVTNG